ncbi:MAG: guanylate kinase, partial [Verrucomicrobiales bacterium]
MEDLHETQQSRSGVLILLSGPAGSGKSTLLRRVLKDCNNVFFSISCTTRSPREGETDGKDYHFLNDDEFNSKIDDNEFLEHAVVHKWKYGTIRDSVKKALIEGKDIIMDIDVQGARQVRECDDDIISNALVDIFITTKDVSELESRLRGRGSEDSETFNLRMKTASEELKEWDSYTYCIISGTQD